MIAQNSEVYNPPTYLFSLYTYMEKDLCRGIVYFTVLCDHPYTLFPYFFTLGVLALVYGQYYSGITLPALAEESGPGISSQLFPRWMTKPLSSPCLKTMA